jgi:hypothetical protein
MRLRDLSERIRDLIESEPEALVGPDSAHALIQDIRDVSMVYRPVQTTGKRSELLPWMSFSFAPFPGLIEPFNIYPGRFHAMLRVHRQPSGLPELVTHVMRDLPGASEPAAPDLYASFSHSPKVETIIKKNGKEPLGLRFFHRGGLMQADRTPLPAEFCLPGIAEALPEGYVDDDIPGMVDLDGEPAIFLGELVFYNQGRTADRRKLSTFLLNCVAVATVSRYVREMVIKGMA